LCEPVGCGRRHPAGARPVAGCDFPASRVPVQYYGRREHGGHARSAAAGKKKFRPSAHPQTRPPRTETERAMLRFWQLGKAFGIGLYIHSTFLLLPLLLLLDSHAEGPVRVLFQLALLAAVFGCVLLHELGHALTARRYGIRTVDITLYPIGGVARLERPPTRLVEELCVALAGPAVNVVIAALLTPLVVGAAFTGLLAGSLEEALSSGGLHVAAFFVGGLWFANVVLVLFNMLPTFPMDGGRVLRALLSMRLDPVRATAIAVIVGRVVLFAGLLALARFAPAFLLSN